MTGCAESPAELSIGGMGEPTVDEWIRVLGLLPHPEGGFYRETHRDDLALDADALPSRFGGPRSASTAIYYLLRRGDFSAFHRIASDEVWHHYAGARLTVHVLHADGRHEAIALGKDLAAGERPQAVVPAGAWFGSRIEGPGEYALVGCTVAPGFDFADFEMATRDVLLALAPESADLVRELTRESDGGTPAPS